MPLDPIILPPAGALGLIHLYSEHVAKRITHPTRAISELMEHVENAELRVTGNLLLNGESGLIFPPHVSVIGEFYLGEEMGYHWSRAPRLLECLNFRILKPYRTPMPAEIRCLRAEVNTTLEYLVDSHNHRNGESVPWSGFLHMPETNDGISNKDFQKTLTAGKRITLSDAAYPGFLNDPAHPYHLLQALNLQESRTSTTLFRKAAVLMPDFDFLPLLDKALPSNNDFPQNQQLAALNHIPREVFQANGPVMTRVREYATKYPKSTMTKQLMVLEKSYTNALKDDPPAIPMDVGVDLI